MTVEQRYDQEPPLLGRWHHGNGNLVCGTIRIAVEDFDTNPPEKFKTEVFDWMCYVLNEAVKNKPLFAESYFGDSPGLGDDIACKHCLAVALDTGLECSECGYDNYEAIIGKPFLPSTELEREDLLEAAQAVIDRWYTPLWKDVPATAVFIGKLQSAVEKYRSEKEKPNDKLK